MVERAGRSLASVWAHLLRHAVVFASAGSAVGLAVALRESLLQGYAGQGYWHSIGLLLRGDAAVGALTGALGILAFVGLRDNAVASFPSLGRVLSSSFPIEFSSGPRWRRARAGLAGAAGGMFLAVRSLEARGFDAAGVAWAAGVALGVWLQLAATGLLARGAAGRADERREALGLASAATLAFLFGCALFFGGAEDRARLASDRSGLALALVAAGLVFWIVQAGASASRRALHLLPLAIGVLLWLAGPLVLQPTLEVGNPRGLVLIGVDTLRFDRTSLAAPAANGAAAGRRARVTPELARLASSSALFRNAISQAPWTMPAFASILTGRYPQEHGAISLFGWLRRGELTLAEVLREAGYQTAAVVSHVLVDARHGFAQGFEHFDATQVRGEAAITSREVTDAAVEWLDRLGRERFFLFLHYFDPHYEYRDHEEWDFADGYQGWIRDEQPDIYSLRNQAQRLRAEDLAHLRDLYDEEVAFTDREIGRFLAAMEARGLEQQIALVVVADHGEEFLERGWLGHTISLSEAVLRVPLLLRLPDVDAAGRVIDTPVETRALYTTLLDYLEVGGVARGSAPSLLPLLRGEGTAPAPVFSSVWLPDAPPESGKRVRRSSVRSGEWKLVRDHDSGDEWFYSLRDDPRETRSLAALAPRRLARLAAALDAWLGRMREARGPVPVRELSEEERRRLEALGYL